MRHKQLKNQIQGSILKEQYLEAFLVQSAYIEGLVKLYVDREYFSKFIYKNEETDAKKMAKAIWKKIDHQKKDNDLQTASRDLGRLFQKRNDADYKEKIDLSKKEYADIQIDLAKEIIDKIRICIP